jgi:hypothetical protein
VSGRGLGVEITIEEQLDRTELKLANITFVEKLLDVAPLRRMAKLMPDHRRELGGLRGVAHFRRLLRIERERLLAEHVLAGLERGDRERMMGRRRARDRDGIDVVPADKLHGVRVHALDAGSVGRPRRLVAIATADRCDVPAFGAKAGDVNLRAEADADDADTGFGGHHRIVAASASCAHGW